MSVGDEACGELTATRAVKVVVYCVREEVVRCVCTARTTATAACGTAVVSERESGIKPGGRRRYGTQGEQAA